MAKIRNEKYQYEYWENKYVVSVTGVKVCRCKVISYIISCTLRNIKEKVLK